MARIRFHPFSSIVEQNQETLILWAPVLFACGILAYFSLLYEPGAVEIICAFLPALFFTIKAYVTRHAARRRLTKYLAVMSGIVALGYAVTAWRVESVQAPILQEKIGPVSVWGRVIQIETQPGGYRLLLDQVDIWQYPKEKTPARVRVVVRTEMQDIFPGDAVKMYAILMPPRRPVYPGGYDFSRYAYFERIGASGFTLSEVKLRGRPEHHMGSVIERWRHEVTERIYAHFRDREGKVSAEGAIAAAMLTGYEVAIPKQTLEEMRVAGLGHIIAISGLNLAIVIGLVFVVVRYGFALTPFIALRYPIKKWAAATALVAGFFYLLLAGAPLSAERAYIMACLFLLAIILDRMHTPMLPVTWAALMILLFQPEALLNAGFQMSFAAVIGLITFFDNSLKLKQHEREISLFHYPRRAINYLLAIIVSTLVATIATTPFALYHFGRIASYGLVANLFAVPLTSLIIMPLGVLSLVAMPLGVESFFLKAMGAAVGWMIEIARWVDSWPKPSLALPTPSSTELLLLTLAFLWLCLWRGVLRVVAIIPAILGIIFFLTREMPDLLISENAKLVGLHQNGELIVSNKTSARFAREEWQQMLGLQEAKSWKQAYGSGGKCTPASCMLSTKNYRIYYQGKEEAPCREAEIVIQAAGECKGTKLTITTQDLMQSGAVALWLQKDAIQMKTVEGERGKRNWALTTTATGEMVLP